VTGLPTNAASETPTCPSYTAARIVDVAPDRRVLKPVATQSDDDQLARCPCLDAMDVDPDMGKLGKVGNLV
jgi:hypothetical protein